MNNKEKAIEIAGLCPSCFECGKPNSGCMECEYRGEYYGAMEMAKHKDEELREYLEERIEHCKGLIGDGGLLQTVYSVKLDAYQEILDKFLEE